jgi:hypothetical protein
MQGYSVMMDSQAGIQRRIEDRKVQLDLIHHTWHRR